MQWSREEKIRGSNCWKAGSLSRGFIINTIFRSLEHNFYSNQITSPSLYVIQKYSIMPEKYYVLLWCISVILSSCLQDWTLIQQRVFVNDNHQNLSKQCFKPTIFFIFVIADTIMYTNPWIWYLICLKSTTICLNPNKVFLKSKQVTSENFVLWVIF